MEILGEDRLSSGTEVVQVKKFDLADGLRTVRFAGEHLATVDADDGERIRWIELSVYKTQAGKYIVHQVGKTVVYHWLTSDCKPKQFTLESLNDLPDDAAPCPVCNPPEPDDLEASGMSMRMESDLERVLIHPDVPSLISSLENAKGGTGRRTHSRVARDLLIKAAQKDEGIRDAFLVTEVA